MLIGLDIGTTALKLAVLEDTGDILFTAYEPKSDRPVEDIVRERLIFSGKTPADLHACAVCGTGADAVKTLFGQPTQPVDEVTAFGFGGCFLAKKQEAIVVSLGTGTAFALCHEGTIQHIGGSGIGGGTLDGLAKKYFGLANAAELSAFAEAGDFTRVDLTVGDLFAGTETLDPRLTASNLAKAEEAATAADWAAGFINLVLQAAGSLAVFACGGREVQTVILTGGLCGASQAKAAYERFQRLYGISFILPPMARYATAIGAAGRLLI